MWVCYSAANKGVKKAADTKRGKADDPLRQKSYKEQKKEESEENVVHGRRGIGNRHLCLDR